MDQCGVFSEFGVGDCLRSCFDLICRVITSNKLVRSLEKWKACNSGKMYFQSGNA